MSPFRRLRLVAVVLAAVPLMSGCFLRLALGGVVTRTTDEEVSEFWAAVEANATAAVCRERETAGGAREVTCHYFFASEFLPETTSTVELIAEFGLFGVFIDPMILQVPAVAAPLVATFREDGGPVRPLEMTVTDSFPAGPGRVVNAEPGTRFLILDLPADVASRLPEGDARSGTPFDFRLELRLPALAPVEVKPMFALKVEVGGETFYPPMFPCVTDFAQAPAIEIPVADPPVNLRPRIEAAFGQAGSLVCDGEVYDFSSPGPGAPSEVDIDVKPGSDRNPVDPLSRGVIPVAVLTTSVEDGEAADFDATTLDPTSVRAGRGEASEAHGGGHIEDVDGDGDLDLVLHFSTTAAEILCGDTELLLSGMTLDGSEVAGRDSIETVGCAG